MRITKAIIPAAGFGTRMLPATKSIPKEMLPLGDKPAIQHIVEEAVSAGITDILIITSRTKTVMEDHFDYSPELDRKLRSMGRSQTADSLKSLFDSADITFIRQNEMLGLGHAVWCGRKFVGSDPFAVLLPDDIIRSKTPVIGQLARVFEDYAAYTVGVKEVTPELVSKYCTLDMQPVSERIFRVKNVIEKPKAHEILSHYSILGRYVLGGDIMGILETLSPGAGGEIQLTDALQKHAQASNLMALDFEGTRYDCGNWSGYMAAAVDFALDNPDCADSLRGHIRSVLPK